MEALPTAVDICCGAGGSVLGAESAGFRTVAGVDHEEQPLQTVHENLAVTPVLHDISEVDLSVLPPAARDADYYHGSPPCKGFSTASGDRDVDDPRNSLVFRYIDWLAAAQPKAATMENVVGITNITDHFMDKVEAAYRDAGYRMRWRILNAADYGVPQTRRRVFVVAVREDLTPPSRWFPKPTHAETPTTTLEGDQLGAWVSVREAIGDLPPADEPEPGQEITAQQNEAHQKAGRRPMPTVEHPADTIRGGTPPQLQHTTNGPTGEGSWREEDRPAHTIGASSKHYLRWLNHVKQDHSEKALEGWTQLEQGNSKPQSKRRLDPSQPSQTITADTGSAVPPIIGDELLNHKPDGDAYSAGEEKKGEHEEALHRPANTVAGSNPYLDQGKRERDALGNAVETSTDERRIRRLTVRECARLQSFPDWFAFFGSKTSQYEQVGNAVPPLLMYHVARHVRTEILGIEFEELDDD